MTISQRRRCFVISPIGPEGSAIREHADNVFEFIIKPALYACDIEARRSDHLLEPGKISDQMFRAILSDDLCVAVLTGYNPNVFYELAIAQAAARPVIILIEKGQLLPFDIHDLRCVQYDLTIRSFADKTYINEIIGHVKSIESAGWVIQPPFGVHPPLGGFRSEVNGPQFVEKAAAYGGAETWVTELERTSSAVDFMGITLTYWHGNKLLNETLVEKARQGCRVRILLMDKENPALRQMINIDTESDYYEVKLKDIDLMVSHFGRLAGRASNISVRQMRKGCPHISLTRTDHVVGMILNLNSEKLRDSPMWLYPRTSRIYQVVSQEFELLWNLNDQVALKTENASATALADR